MARAAGGYRTFTGHCYCAGGDGFALLSTLYPSWRAAATQPAELYVMNKILLQCDNLCKRYQEAVCKPMCCTMSVSASAKVKYGDRR